MKNLHINFVNRLAIQSIIAMFLSEWFYHESYQWCDIAPAVIGMMFIAQLVAEVVRFFRNFKISKKGE